MSIAGHPISGLPISGNPENSTILPSGIVSGEAFGTATIVPGVATISPSGIASGEAFGTVMVMAMSGTITIMPSGIGSGEAFGTATIIPGVATISPSGIASGEAFGVTLVTRSFPQTIFPSGIPSGSRFGRLTAFFPGKKLPFPDCSHVPVYYLNDPGRYNSLDKWGSKALLPRITACYLPKTKYIKPGNTTPGDKLVTT
jgi:hypothetical protein